MALKMKTIVNFGLNIVQRQLLPRCATSITMREFSCIEQIPQRNIEIYSLRWNNATSCFFQNKSFYATQKNSKEVENKKKSVIYFGVLGSKMKGLKVVSFTTSFIAIFVQPYIYNDMAKLALPISAVFYTFVGFFTFITPLIIHSLAKRYITEIIYYSDEDYYVAKTITFFLGVKTEKFKLSDIRFAETPRLFTTFYIKDKPFLIFEESFLDKDHFIKMMGYDKPIDLKIHTQYANNPTKKAI